MQESELYQQIAEILIQARNKSIYSVNQTMVNAYYEIGKHIVLVEQQGKIRATYGKQLLENISSRLTHEFGKGFSIRNLEQMRQFYLVYSNGIPQTVSAEFTLSWSHYLFLTRIENPEERKFYEIEAQKSRWSLRELKRQFDSALYERLALSRDRQKVAELSSQGIIVETSQDLIKDPYVLEFLGLPENARYSESELEERIINKLETFLLELGKGYTFVGRQVRFTFDEKHFYVDLVFFNRILQCFVLIDLKIGELTHQDLGQMQMYVHYYDRFVKLPHEQKTIGIILCKKKDDSLVEITLPENNDQIFASKYQTILPSKSELIHLLETHASEKENSGISSQKILCPSLQKPVSGV